MKGEGGRGTYFPHFQHHLPKIWPRYHVTLATTYKVQAQLFLHRRYTRVVVVHVGGDE